MLAKIIASCLFIAAQTYEVPPAVMLGILSVEGGRVGQEVRNTNGSADLGPMQINTIWMPELAKHWNVSEATARKWVRDDPCTNMSVSAWILRQHMNETGNLAKSIEYYHSRTPSLGRKYKGKVVDALERKGLVKVK